MTRHFQLLFGLLALSSAWGAQETRATPSSPAAPAPQDPEDPLIIVSVTARDDATHVRIVFSRPVDRASAERIEHYSIASEIKVLKAERGADLVGVTLATSPMEEGKKYLLTVRGVQDCRTPPGLVDSDAPKEFAFSKGIFGPGAPPSHARVNHARRPLPPMPKFREAIPFNTPEADAILSSLQIFPPDSAWNEDITKRPVDPLSEKMIAKVGAEKHLNPSRAHSFTLVPPNQPKVDVKLGQYAAGSDKGPYPVPPNASIESWPLSGEKLEDNQRTGTGDRHLIVLDPVNSLLYEFFYGFKKPAGWEASGAAIFDLRTNQRRPYQGSAIAAGTSLFAGLVRHDECERGLVEHAIRCTIAKHRNVHLYPATTHPTDGGNDPALPAMGQRFRLKASVELSGFPKHALAIALGLKKYGMIVTDDGLDWDIDIASDPRISGLDALRKLKGSDFEVIIPTGEHEGPRAASGGK
jgi:hypothetical protein